MDEIKIFRYLIQKSLLHPSGISDIRSSVWKGVDSAEQAFADSDSNSYGYINIISMRISSMAAAVILSCVIASYVIVDSYMKGGAMLSSYYNILDGMYSVFWGIF